MKVSTHMFPCLGRLQLLATVLALVLFVLTGSASAVMPDEFQAGPSDVISAGNTRSKSELGPVKESKKYKDGELLVKFKEHVPADKKDKKHKKLGHEKIKEFKYIKVHHVRLKQGGAVEQAIAEYKADPDVEYAEPNYIVYAQGGSSTPPNDFYFAAQTLWGLKKIQTPQAWQTSTGSSDVVVAVIDSGIDYNHPDLSANLWSDGESHGYNVLTGYNNPMDDNGHGTHVAGTIGAVGNNNVGVVGVNWNVTIMACKFLDASGSGSTADAVTCLEYIKTKKIESYVNIIASNNSWGGGEYSDTLHDAIKSNGDAGILFIAAAGNDYGNNNDLNPHYPSSYDLPNVISVAATDRFDDKANFSNIGRQSVHVGAPGKGILSTYKGSYSELSGTSMATPHVTGVAALIKAQNPGYDWSVIRNLLVSHGDDVPAMKDVTISGKRINAARSIACSSESNTPFFAIKKFPVEDVQAGVPVVLEAYSFSDCGSPLPYGAVTVSIPGEVEDIVLRDDVTSYNQETKHYEVTNDGVYTGTWTPGFSGRADFTFNFPGGVRKAASTTPLAITSAVSIPASQIDTYKEGTVIYAMLDGNFSQTLSASGGDGNYGWSITAGTLPPGLTLNGFTGAISGNPTTKGVYSYTIEVASGQMTSHSQFRMAVNSDLGGVELIEKRFESSYSLPPLVADLDGDGNDEVLVADGTKLNLYGKDGLINSFAIPMRNPYQIMYNFAAGDLDNDGKKEVVFVGDPYTYGLAGGNDIVILDHRLNVIRNIPICSNHMCFKEIYTPVLADLFNDGNKEILYITSELNVSNSKYDVYLNIIDRFGNQLSGWPKELGFSDGKHRDHAPAVGDVDGDGTPEIVIATNDGMAHIYRADGTETKSWEVASSSPNHYYFSRTPLLIDTDGQGIPNIAMLMGTSVRVYNPNGDKAFLSNFSSQYSLVAADLDNDGKQELITADSGWIYGIKNNANIPNWPISISSCTPEAGMYTSIPINATPIVGDINGDGLQEILITATASPGSPYDAFPGKWMTKETLLCAFSAQTGQLLDGYPKRMIPGSAGSLTTPALADIDGNGRMDVVVKNEDGSLVKWQSAQQSATPKIDWPMFLGGSEHLGSKRKRNVEVMLSPGIFTFGGVTVGTSSTKSIVVSNRGSQTATVEYLGVTSGNADGSFAISPGTCGASPFTLAPNSSCTYEAVFTPTSIGLKTATIKFSYVDGRTLFPTVTMSGYGSHIVTASSDGPAAGWFSFSGVPMQQDCTGSGGCIARFRNGETVTISFDPSDWANYVVAGWSGCDSVQGKSCIVTMTADKSVVAHTDVKKFDVKVFQEGSGTVTPYTAKVPIHGSHTITFRPAPGYYLESLSESTSNGLEDKIGEAVPDSNGFEYSYTLNDVTAAHNLEAIFNNDITDGTLGFLMNEAKPSISSVVLPDGRLLVAGVEKIEEFDPSTRSFRVIGSLPEPRSGYTATVLNDGRVLIAGGALNFGTIALQSALLYDPATGAMTTLQMSSPRKDHRATLLADGRVLVTGGRNNGQYVETAEIFDPSGGGGGTFTEIAGPGSVNYHRTVRLPDSKVLVAFSDRSAYLYDPENGFVPTGNMLDSHDEFTATLLSNGKVLIVGGYLTNAELYDPATETFSYATTTSGVQAKPSVIRGTHSALLLSDGRVILAGGQPYTNSANAVEYYDTTTGEFGDVGRIGYDRKSPALFELPTGEVLIAGGTNVRTSVIISTTLNSLNYAATGNGQGTVMLSAAAAGSGSSPQSIGTCGGSSCQKRIENGTTVTLTAVPIYNSDLVGWSGCDTVDGTQCTVAMTSEKSVTAEFALKTFTVQGNVLSGNGSITPAVRTVAYGETVSYSITPASGAYLRRLLHNGSLESAESGSDGSLVYTIRNVSGNHQIDVEFSDAAIPQVSQMLFRRYNHTATLLQDGRVLIAGGTATGVDASGNYYDYGIRAAELYDPASGIFTTAGEMLSSARNDGVRATLLQDGRVLLTGGIISGITAHNDAELYNPATNLFSISQGAMTASRAFHSSALLSDGRVLIAGGQQNEGTATNTAEIFDPASGRFTSVSTGMATKRKHHTSTVLPNGKVFIAGGLDENGAAVATAELYDPSTGMFTAIGAMNIAHAKHRAILLPHGQVLLIDESGSAELFDPATNTFRGILDYDPEWDYYPLLAPRQDFTATLGANGNVIVVGEKSWYTSSTVDSVNYYTETSSAVVNVVSPRTSHAATLLDNGKILITGGKHGHGLSSAVLLDVPALVSINPSTTNFSEVPLASTASRSVIITNTSADARSLDAITVAGPDSSMFNVSGGSCGTLSRQMSAQESCDININFSPIALGKKSATLLISFSGTVASSNVEGTGIAPMTISPNGIDFSTVLLNSTATKTITLTNITTTSRPLDSVTFAGEGSGMFTVSGGTCGSLPRQILPQETCYIDIRFTPTSLGDKNVTLIASVAGTLVSSSIHGVGVLPAIDKLSTQGSLFAWGANSFGELGDGTFTRTTTPVVANIENVAAVVSGNGFTFAVKGDGTVWGWGTGNTTPTTPTQIPGLSNVVAISRALALKWDGTVWKLNGTTCAEKSGLINIVAISNGGDQSLALDGDGAVWEWRADSSPVKVLESSGQNRITAVAAGNGQSLALNSDGTVWGWGVNNSCNLGDRVDTSLPAIIPGLIDVEAIAGGDWHSMALHSDGTISAWGGNYYGALGSSHVNNNINPISCIPVKVTDGNVTDGNGNAFSGVSAIAANSSTSMALKADGTVWSWGYNADGQVGDGTTEDRYTPVPVTGLQGPTSIDIGRAIIPFRVMTDVLPYVAVGIPYQTTLQASTAAIGATYTWSFDDSAIQHPGWLNIDPSTGELWSNNPPSAGSFSFDVKVVANNGKEAPPKRLTIWVCATICSALQVDTTSLPDGVTDTDYNYQLAASGGVGPYVWSGVALPAGFTINSAGLLSGNTAAPGPLTIKGTVKDATGHGASFSLPLVIKAALNLTMVGPGTVTFSPGTSCSANCTQVYPAGTTVVLTSSSTPAVTFDHWDGCDQPNGTVCTVTMNGSKNVMAVYRYVDLAVTAVSFTNVDNTPITSPVTTGTPVSVSATVTNVGTRSTATMFYVNVYLSNDSDITTADTMMVQCAPYGLNAGASFKCEGQYTIPIGKAGSTVTDFYVGAIADRATAVPDDLWRVNNKAVATQPLGIYRDKYPNLAVTDVSYKNIDNTQITGPVTTGTPILVSATVTNVGNWSTGNTFYVNVYLSNDADITTADTTMVQCAPNGLNVTASFKCEGQYTIPIGKAGSTVTDFYVGAIADRATAVPDDLWRENNKAVATQPLSLYRDKYPDLAVTAVSFKNVDGTQITGPVTTGTPILVSATVTNVGNWSTANNFFINVYLSNDADITTADTMMVQCAPGGLNVDAEYICTGQYTIPTGKTGDFYVGAIADRAYSVSDDLWRENNTKVILDPLLKITAQ